MFIKFGFIYQIYAFIVGSKIKFNIRFQSYKSAMNFKFKLKTAAILQQRYVDKFRVLLLEKFISQMSFFGCFKTAVKLNLLDDALNLAFDRLKLTFSIEKLQV